MDSFDTILEQLNQAQGQDPELVADTLDSIAERLGRLVEEAKAEIAEAASARAGAEVPMDGIRAAIEEARAASAGKAEETARLAQRVKDLEESLGAGSAGETAGGPTLELLRRLDAARSQSELLRQLLPALCDFVDRAAVLVIRESQVSAWSGVGFSDGEKLREWRCGVADSSALARMAGDGRPVMFVPSEDGVFSAWLGRETPAMQAILVPVVLRGNLMGGVYADVGEGGSWAPESAQALVAVACWMIDTLSLRQTVPSPMLTEAFVVESTAPDPSGAEEVVADERPGAIDEGESVGSFDAQEDDAGTPSFAEQEAELAIGEQKEVAAPDDVPSAGEEAGPADMPPSMSPVIEPEQPEFDPSATMRVEVAEQLMRQPQDVAVEIPAPAEAPVAPKEPPPVAPVVPPPPVEDEAVEGPPSGMTEEEEAQHEEARRFARLLISEIKLYNEEEVERGRAAKDLYQRLKEDIDRSREMYDKRISEEVRESTDYFHEELVRILAEGDRDAIGM